jgi:hypothetical protein
MTLNLWLRLGDFHQLSPIKLPETLLRFCFAIFHP